MSIEKIFRLCWGKENNWQHCTNIISGPLKSVRAGYQRHPLDPSVNASCGHHSSGIITLDKSSVYEPLGLFIKLFEYSLLKKQNTSSAFASVETNASYKLAMIQKETVEILKKSVLEKVVLMLMH